MFGYIIQNEQETIGELIVWISAPGFGIRQDNIAPITGVARESLIRTPGDFRDEGTIEIRNGAICIRDIRNLGRMVDR